MDLLARCSEIETSLNVPFSVILHGDLNTNNLVYDHETQTIKFIDLYRSQKGDYVQDASVFLISNFRLPFFRKGERALLNQVICHFYNAFKRYAAENEDSTFEMRMALALVRSFYTSTRFEMNPVFSKHMFLRAHYLMEKIAAHGSLPPEYFKLPEDVLYY